MKKLTIRERVLRYLQDTGMSVAELSRRTGVSYDALNKFKHREGGTSDENGERLRNYLDQVEQGRMPASEKREMVISLARQLDESKLQEALSMLQFLEASSKIESNDQDS